MANYHLSIKIISRGKGKSAVAAAAYRAGETIKNEYDGFIHDYTRKGGIVHTEILLPDNAPIEYLNRSVLWNAVEKSERYKTAQLSREIEISLPSELTREQNISLALRYAKETFVNYGMCADVCVHDKGDGNPHAHIMLTMRPIEKDGKWGQKSYTVNGRKINTVNWHDRNKAEDWRKAWAEYCNVALSVNGHGNTIDHRSYKRQGVEQIPTVHLGSAASQMERRGIRTERGNINRAIEISNKEIRQLRARINKLNKWIETETANIEPPTLADVISDILNRQGQSGVSKLKAASQMLLFLQENKIYDTEGLEQKVKSMRGKANSVNEDLKKVNRRIDTLKEHIRHSENFKNYRKIKARYEELYSQYKTAQNETGLFAQRKAQKALDAANEYHEAHRAEIAMFESAEQYLRDVLQKRFDPKKLPPITKWREELAGKTAERERLYREFTALQDEAKKVENIKRSVMEIMQIETPEREIARARGLNY